MEKVVGRAQLVYEHELMTHDVRQISLVVARMLASIKDVVSISVWCICGIEILL